MWWISLGFRNGNEVTFYMRTWTFSLRQVAAVTRGITWPGLWRGHRDRFFWKVRIVNSTFWRRKSKSHLRIWVASRVRSLASSGVAEDFPAKQKESPIEHLSFFSLGGWSFFFVPPASVRRTYRQNKESEILKFKVNRTDKHLECTFRIRNS